MARLRALMIALACLAGSSALTAPAPPPLYEGLGTHARTVATTSPDAQRYFDQGLAFLYAFNHDEAIRSFTHAGALDPGCAMAWWGVAYANGPHINNPVVPEERAKAAWEALSRARAAAAKARPVEQALIEALSARYALPQPEDRKPLDQAYADAMRKVWAAHPKDADVGALFAEALADLRPWDLWTPEGAPQPGTEELVATLEVLMRFGRWDEILAEPAFPEVVPISRSLQHYARAVAHAAKGELDAAREEQAAFAAVRTRVAKEATFGNNSGGDILDVAESFMRGEILFRSGKIEEGLASLKEAAAREDRLRYDEPPDWIQPVRHAWGAALLQAGRFAEAEAVFREDLAKLPENGWGLYGLSRALALQKKADEATAVEKRFDAVWEQADLKIKSACLCLPGV